MSITVSKMSDSRCFPFIVIRYRLPVKLPKNTVLESTTLLTLVLGPYTLRFEDRMLHNLFPDSHCMAAAKKYCYRY